MSSEEEKNLTKENNSQKAATPPAEPQRVFSPGQRKVESQAPAPTPKAEPSAPARAPEKPAVQAPKPDPQSPPKPPAPPEAPVASAPAPTPARVQDQSAQATPVSVEGTAEKPALEERRKESGQEEVRPDSQRGRGDRRQRVQGDNSQQDKQERGERPQEGQGKGRRRRRGRGRDRQNKDRDQKPQADGQQRARGDGQKARQERDRRPRPDRQPRGERHSGRQVQPQKKIKREILANTNFEETRIAIIEDGRLAELLWERQNAQSIVGNIYKGQIENVLPGISSAFVNIGFDKNAYLYISDVLGERGAPIDKTLKRGRPIMIQVAKEAIGTKGMKVTMDVSLPGRFLVFTPFQTEIGLSKHIAEGEERKRLSGIIEKLSKEHLNGKGVVVRTEAEGANEEELEREVKYLAATWSSVQAKFESDPAPALLHKDLNLALQVARDILSEDIYVYMLDNKQMHKQVIEFVERISPEVANRVQRYEAKTPIFKAFNLEEEIEKLRKIKVPLPNGGSIIVQEAESLCAIDVNTGRFTGSKSQEDTVTQTNIEAAKEVAHQIRLRNIGGIIVVDFIDMRKASNRNRVMECFGAAVKRDRAKIRILPITRLGLIEMTRERKRESTVSLITDECPDCKGAGRVLSAETLRIRIQREIYEMTAGRPGGQIKLLLHPVLAEIFRSKQNLIEKNIQRSVKINSDPQLAWEDYRITLE